MGNSVMGITDGMKGITDNILTSYNTRVKALGDLVFDTHKTLNGFASDRNKMAKEQANNLANFVEDLSKNVQDTLEEFEKRHREMGRRQAKNLADFVKNLTKISLSDLNDFKKQRTEMAQEIKDMLTKEMKDIKNEVRKLIDGYRSDIEKASRAWKEMCVTLAKARGNGIMPRLQAGENVPTATAAGLTKKKARRG